MKQESTFLAKQLFLANESKGQIGKHFLLKEKT